MVGMVEWWNGGGGQRSIDTGTMSDYLIGKYKAAKAPLPSLLPLKGEEAPVD